MGKFIGYAFMIFALLFALEWFQIFDVPYFEIPDYTGGKDNMVGATQDSLEQLNK